MNSNSTPGVASSPNLLNAVVQRLAGQSAACKLCGAVLAAVVLLFAAGRSGGESLLWAAAPVGLLALVDAGYVATARRLATAARGTAGTGGEIAQLQVTEGGIQEAGNLFAGALSLSVWPFYLALGGLIVGLGTTVLAPKTQPIPGVAGRPQQMSFANNLGQPFDNAPSNMGQPSAPRGYPGTPPGASPPNGYAPSGAPSPVGTPSSGPFTTSRFPNAPGNRPTAPGLNASRPAAPPPAPFSGGPAPKPASSGGTAPAPANGGVKATPALPGPTNPPAAK